MLLRRAAPFRGHVSDVRRRLPSIHVPATDTAVTWLAPEPPERTATGAPLPITVGAVRAEVRLLRTAALGGLVIDQRHASLISTLVDHQRCLCGTDDCPIWLAAPQLARWCARMPLLVSEPWRELAPGMRWSTMWAGDVATLVRCNYLISPALDVVRFDVLNASGRPLRQLVPVTRGQCLTCKSDACLHALTTEASDTLPLVTAFLKGGMTHVTSDPQAHLVQMRTQQLGGLELVVQRDVRDRFALTVIDATDALPVLTITLDAPEDEGRRAGRCGHCPTGICQEQLLVESLLTEESLHRALLGDLRLAA